MCAKVQLSISDSSRDIKRVPNFTIGRQISTQTSPSFWGLSLRAFGVDRGRSLIVRDGGDVWHVISLSGDVKFTNCYTTTLYLYLLSVTQHVVKCLCIWRNNNIPGYRSFAVVRSLSIDFVWNCHSFTDVPLLPALLAVLQIIIPKRKLRFSGHPKVRWLSEWVSTRFFSMG